MTWEISGAENAGDAIVRDQTDNDEGDPNLIEGMQASRWEVLMSTRSQNNVSMIIILIKLIWQINILCSYCY